MKEKEVFEKYKIARKYFEKGKNLYEKGEYTWAQKELDKCIEVMPQHVYAHFYLSQIIYKKGNFPKALDHMEKAKANFDYMTGLYSLAYQDYIDQLREEKDQLDKDVFALKLQLSETKDPQEKAKIQTAIGLAEQKIGIVNSRLTEPVVQEESMPADFCYFHGNVFFKLKRYQEAYREYLEAIKIDPEHGNAYNNLANLYFMSKNYQKALDCLNQAEQNGVKINSKFKKAILKALKK
jgi:pentatricopeptide repeat protein